MEKWKADLRREVHRYLCLASARVSIWGGRDDEKERMWKIREHASALLYELLREDAAKEIER